MADVGAKDGPARLTLASSLDSVRAPALLDELKALRGRPVALDASCVERLGALCLQVLLAARAAWDADGVAFGLQRPSEAFDRAFALMGAGHPPAALPESSP